MATSRQAARRTAAPNNTASTDADEYIRVGFSTTDIPVSVPAAEPSTRSVPLCAVSVVVLLVVLALIVFS
ncbi:hypothetical protein [Jongsikchunia kroppenstedtii]|uniref:hypothetical protein n=1 Tax=Jongsikchunia kroppenstedtii TaxID=1121721 RepID=UPI00037A7891|nr:hypothetical protein [Jongsikchunia kroppenstedtii]